MEPELPDELPHESSASNLWNVKQGKINFGLNGSNLVSPQKTVCKESRYDDSWTNEYWTEN